MRVYNPGSSTLVWEIERIAIMEVYLEKVTFKGRGYEDKGGKEGPPPQVRTFRQRKLGLQGL